MNRGKASDAIEKFRIGIVGCGPRGLSIFEQVLRELQRAPQHICTSIVIWEPSLAPGAGVNYHDEADENSLLNIPIRQLNIRERGQFSGPRGSIVAFPSVDMWISRRYPDLGEDDFPLREILGEYLHERFQSLLDCEYSGIDVEVLNLSVSCCEQTPKGWILSSDQTSREVDHVHVCIGHQPQTMTGELTEYKTAMDGRFRASVYPADELSSIEQIPSEACVALRGFGLSAIDAIVALTQGRGGKFSRISSGQIAYQRAGREPTLVPYTLDGLTPVPKPHSTELDRTFDPFTGNPRINEQISQAILAARSENSLDPIIDAAASIMSKHCIDSQLLKARTPASSFAEFIQEPVDTDLETDPQTAMSRYLEMAMGRDAPTLGYVAGQIWRHLEHTLYQNTRETLSVPGSERILESLIKLDEGMKRLSYGPPAVQIGKLLALLRQGVLIFDHLNNPTIELREGNLFLRNLDREQMCTHFIDTVLAGTSVDELDSPLLQQMAKSNLISSPSSGLGYVSQTDQLSLYGRINAQEAFGADSIHAALRTDIGSSGHSAMHFDRGDS